MLVCPLPLLVCPFVVFAFVFAFAGLAVAVALASGVGGLADFDAAVGAVVVVLVVAVDDGKEVLVDVVVVDGNGGVRW